MVGIIDPYLKLEWAKHHLMLLDLEVAHFVNSRPYMLERYDDPKLQRHVIKARLKEVSDGVVLTAGDAITCMRSSLDHLVWSLARGPGGVIQPDHTQFPILECLNSDARKRFRRQTAGVPQLALEEIKSFQPYRRGNAFKTDPLWRLNTLRNLHEHRRIPANGSELVLQGFPEHLAAVFKIEVVGDYHVLSVPLACKSEVQFEPTITFKVNFGWGDPFVDSDAVSISKEGLWEIHNFIAESLLPKFIRFFPTT